MKRIHRVLCGLLVLCITLGLGILPVTADDPVTITTTLNIAQANKNQRGHGYEWHNRTDVLDLNGLYLDTTNDYGLRLPKDCTVNLSGTNYIKASKYALSCAGTVFFKGSGKLILDAGEAGIFIYTEVGTEKVRLLEGEYEIHSAKYGVLSTAADFSFVDGKMTITVDDPDGAAVSGRIVNLLGGTFTANSAVEASHMLTVKGSNLDVSANRAAFSAKNLTVSDISLTADGAAVAEYGGQSVVKGTSTLKRVRASILFGENVNGVVDYICLAALFCCIAAAVVVPIVLHKKKVKKLLARLEIENPDAAAALKKAK